MNVCASRAPTARFSRKCPPLPLLELRLTIFSSSRAARRALRQSVSGLALAGACGLVLAARPAAAQSGPINYDFRGADGGCCTNSNGHDGSPGQRDFIQTDRDLIVRSTTTGQAGVTVNVSGGRGGDGDSDAVSYHWGGNGGVGRNLDYLVQYSTIMSAGRGIDICSAGGDGGQSGYANGPNGGYGIGADGHLARVTLQDVTVDAIGLGVAAQSSGGLGRDSALVNGFGGERDAGSGGNSGDATVNLRGSTTITVRGAGPGDASAGVGLISRGGNGGTAIHTGDFGGHSNAGRAGNAGNVTFASEAQSTITTSGDGVYGVIARSIGGDASVLNGQDTRAESGGNAGTVTINNAGTITTSGNRAVGIFALSQGGQGGNGGDGSWGDGHRGAPGGTPGAITVSNTGAISTGTSETVGARGIVAQVLGGQGGPGGTSGAFGSGGSGAPGGGADRAIAINNAGVIGTAGNDAAGIIAHTVGGGGGQSGVSNGIFYIGGGNGGSGGNGGDATLANSGTITTAGDHSPGAILQSIGGGGGVGGDANATGIIATIAIGGRGGVAGSAGNIAASSSSGSIATIGASSAGVLLQSIGGGGGRAGSANAVGVGVGLDVTLSTGGNGGVAGNGGIIQFNNEKGGSITTSGPHSAGIVAQAIGGGGGDGGLARSRTITIAPPTDDNPSGTLSIAVTHGGTAGAGGDGGIPDIFNAGSITTAAAMSNGITAQSIGGGGGNGGGVLAPMKIPTVGPSNINIGVTVSHGGNGGGGGNGNWVRVANTGTIMTGDTSSVGILAQSIGGGGGNGGTVQQHDTSSFNSIVGSPITFLSSAKTVAAWIEKGALPTFWPPAWDKKFSANVSVTIGGSGGSGGNASYFDIRNGGTIRTSGAHAPGIVAQSIGGGGGNAGAIDSGAVTNLISSIDQLAKAIETGVKDGPTFGFPTLNPTFQVGGNGGAGGDGGGTTATPALVINTGTIATTGLASAGIVAQSIGGGGGTAAVAAQSLEDAVKKAGGSNAAEILQTMKYIVETAGTKFGSLLSDVIHKTVGGQNGLGGDGGIVLVDASASTSRISTQGAQAPGIIAQSIGGGGGIAASSHAPLFPGSGSATMTLGGARSYMGGFLPVPNSKGDLGQSVTIRNGGAITTKGVNAAGLIGQSIGGGGGLSSTSFASQANVSAQSMQYTLVLGAKLSASVSDVTLATGGAVSIDNTGTADAPIHTSGALSHGIIAQSVGGGGGIAILSANAPAAIADVWLGAQRDPGGAGLAVIAKSGDVTVGGDPNKVSPSFVTTNGAMAFGILAQSVGAGGGYIAYDNGVAERNLPTTLRFGSAGTVVGAGGTVGVTQNPGGRIDTSGMNAHAIVAQSIGGGGGIAGLATRPGQATLSNSGTPPSNAAPSINAGGRVNVRTGGAIETRGDGAIGILAQSIGGGGGLTGDASAARYGDGLIRATDITSSVGNGGNVNVTVGGGSVITHGANAPAIFAMSVGGGGVFMDGALHQFNTIGNMPTSGGTIGITVGGGASVIATGANSPAIVALTTGSYGGGSPVTIDVGKNATVAANTETGIGILSVAPWAGTTIDNAGTISAKTAISTIALVTVNNTGLVSGDINLHSDPQYGDGGTFNNNAGGTFWSGASVKATVINNAGTLNPGGPGVFLTSRIQGSLQQISGVYAPDLDFTNHRGDFISVSGVSTFAGTLTPVLHNPVKDVWLGIGHFDTAQTSIPAVKTDSPVFSYTLKNNGPYAWRDPLIAVNGNFTPVGVALSNSQSQLAVHLQSQWNLADPRTGPFFNRFTTLSSGTDYVKALGALANDAAHSGAASQLQQSFAFLNSLMSCPFFVDGGTRLSEGDCLWGRITGNRLDRDGSAESSGYHTTRTTYQVGAQKEIAPDWFLGGSLSYAAANMTADQHAVEMSSQTVSAGLALKRQIGPWLFAAAIHGGHESADVTRWIVFPGVSERATSNSDTYHLGGRLRASYEFAFQNWYLRPFLDLDVNYASQSAYREQGAGVLDLASRGASHTSFMATPSVEIGGRFDLAEATLRTYAIAGVSFLSNGDWTSRLQFADLAGKGVAPFTVRTNLPKTYGNLTAGLEYRTKGGFELKAEYGLRAGDRYLDQSAMLRAAVRF